MPYFKKIIITFLLIQYSCCSHAEIYKWVDEQGETHYGDKSVVNSKEVDVDISKQGHIKINNKREIRRKKLLETYADDQQRKDKEKKKQKKKRKKLKRECIKSKDRLRHYERASSLYKLDKDGNRITMSNEKREQKTSALREKIKKYCK